MLAHLEAIASLISGTYTVHIGAAPAVTGQYVVIAGPSDGADGESPICDEGSSFQANLRVTAVTGTPEGVFKMLAVIRGLIDKEPLTLTGRSAYVMWQGSESEPDIDTSVKIIDTNRNPAFGVDAYWLVSESTQ